MCHNDEYMKRDSPCSNPNIDLMTAVLFKADQSLERKDLRLIATLTIRGQANERLSLSTVTTYLRHQHHHS